MAFIIKQGDLRPNLPFQILEADGVTGLDLTNATSVSFVMRKKGTTEVVVKDECVLTDLVDGEGYYDWKVGDTDVAGSFEYEFEILWADSSPQTVPVDKYLDLSIIDDIG